MSLYGITVVKKIIEDSSSPEEARMRIAAYEREYRRQINPFYALWTWAKERFKEEPSPCPLPPTGWRCTRTRGHEGPCAAIPD